MRLLALIFLLLFIAAGVVFGALNADLVSYDLGFAHVSVPKGAAALVAVVIGWVLGGLTAWLGTSVSHRRRRRRERADIKASAAPAA
ncbi:putative integral membrane protein [Luteibacter sp. Sphag1AF]|uniref:lipopolysaccharide assembly protein LapA domain-containing protein n=1 Tax=Luteibacter sp. Sphag1AF TaxID=2587031 RepID=UPI00161C556B|nr:lipopolysaccharide assembly protein LapA domain-containing protein [Luteibacter sp. Sphag1AF]MBB3226923.1 putative integral membrane protein [Luteibacter sp. Sphag1AF]